MKRTIICLAAMSACTVGTAYAMYSTSENGEWPRSWPKELEPLRKQARTLVGPMGDYQHFAIRFANREEFESAWPHLLEVKTKGAPVVLSRGPSFFLGGDVKAGVVVHAPPRGRANLPAAPEVPIPGLDGMERWMNTTYIELFVDGTIVDLNRNPLPADTPIVDGRFKGKKIK